MSKPPEYIDLSEDDPFKSLMEMAASDPQMRTALQRVISMWRFSSTLTWMMNALLEATEQQQPRLANMAGLLAISAQLPDDIRAAIEPQILRIDHMKAGHSASLREWGVVRLQVLNRFEDLSLGPHYKTVKSVLANLLTMLGSQQFRLLLDRVARELPVHGEVLYDVDTASEPEVIWSSSGGDARTPALEPLAQDLLSALAIVNADGSLDAMNEAQDGVWPSAHDEDDSHAISASPKVELATDAAREPRARSFLDALASVLGELPYMVMHADDYSPSDGLWDAPDVDVIRLLQEYKVLLGSQQEAIEVEWLSLGVMLNDVNAVQSEAIGLYGRMAAKLSANMNRGRDADEQVGVPVQAPSERATETTRARWSLVLALAATVTIALLLFLAPDSKLERPNPVVTTSEPNLTPLPVTESAYQICEPKTQPLPGQPAPGMTIPALRKASRVTLLNETGSVILERKNKPSLQITVTEVPEKQGSKAGQAAGTAPKHKLNLDDLKGFGIEFTVRSDIHLTVEAE